MSITFHPSINLNKPLSEDAIWSGYWFQHAAWSDLPKNLQTSEIAGMDQAVWEAGGKPFEFWQDIANKYNLPLIENYNLKKIWALKENDKYLLGLSVTGEPKEAHGVELNLANANARILFQILGIQEESGQSHPLPILKKIEKILNQRDRLDEFTRDYEESQDNGPKMINFGLPKEQILNYLLRLEEICDHCIKYECNISWG